MPRGKGLQTAPTTNMMSMAQDLASTMTDKVYTIEDLDLSIEENQEIFEENGLVGRKGVMTMIFGPDTPPAKPSISRLMQRLSTIYRIPMPKKFHVSFYPPMPKSKTALHTISSASMTNEPNFMYRIVAVIGSIELFDISDSPIIGSLLGQKKIFLRGGYGVKFNVGPANMVSLKYDDRDSYDNKTYPGRGAKNPEKRWIVLIDIFGDSRGDAEAVSAKVAESLVSKNPHVMKLMQQLQSNPEMLKEFMSKDLTNPNVVESLKSQLMGPSKQVPQAISIASELDQAAVESPTDVIPDVVSPSE